MSSIGRAIYEAMGDTAQWSDVVEVKFLLLDANDNVEGSVSNTTAGELPAFAPAGSNNLQFAGNATKQYTISGVAGDFSKVEVQVDLGDGNGLTTAYIFTFATQSPNGNNVNLNNLEVTWNNADANTSATEDGGAYLMQETGTMSAFQVNIIQDLTGAPSVTNERDTSVTMQAEPLSSQISMTDAQAVVTNNSGSTIDPADGARIEHDSTTTAALETVSDGDLGGNSFQWPDGSDIEIGGITITWNAP